MSHAIMAAPADRITGFSKRRVAELAGLALFAFAAFATLALLSFHEADPSFNVATESGVRNWMGAPGAYFANPTLQTVGMASALVALVPLAWGWRLLRGLRITHPGMRVASFLVSLVLLSGLLTLIEAPEWWPIAESGMGGAIGRILMKGLMLRFFQPIAAIVIILMALGLSLPFGFGLRFDEWKTIAAFCRKLAMLLAGSVAFLRARTDRDVAAMAYDREVGPSRFSRLLERFRKEEPATVLEEGALPDVPLPEKKLRRSLRKMIVEAPVKKERNRQPSLELKAGKGKYNRPSLEMLSEPDRSKKKKKALDEEALAQNARILETVLKDFGVNGEIVKVRPGPVVTLYELEPAAGTRSSRVVALADDIARSMSAISARIAPVPGRNVIGIELPNVSRETVYLRELLEDSEYSASPIRLPLALGKDISGAPIVVDLSRMPHLLVAGTTGSGKSVAINTMIMSLVYKLTPDQCKFIMIDPKMLELSIYENIPHLLAPVVTEPGKAVVALKWTVKEMENRYRLMSSLGVRNIDGYNKAIIEAKGKGASLKRTVQTGFDPDSGKPIYEEQPLDMTPLPFIVVIVDEMADLMLVAGKEIETSIQRLAQMARAAGIHIIMATQRPSVDVITGVIKANFPTRISFQVTSRIDSRTILGEQGAEQLLGQGDMLYMAGGGRITRVHGPYVSDKEVIEIVKHLREQGTPTYIEDVTVDPEEEGAFGEGGEDGDAEEGLYKQAVSIVLRDRKASTSYLQRFLKLGYNRAARLIDRMEEEGIVGPASPTGKREVIGR